MPVAYIDIPTGTNDGAKKKIFKETYEAIHEAWPIPDTRILIREWANQAVSQDGEIEDAPMRPICTLAVPPGLEHDAKQKLVCEISTTLGEACGRKVEEIRLPSGTRIYTIGSSLSSGSFRSTRWLPATSLRPRIPWCSRTCLRNSAVTVSSNP